MREVERADAAKQLAELQEVLQAEKVARLAAEGRVPILEQQLEASHKRNKVRALQQA